MDIYIFIITIIIFETSSIEAKPVMSCCSFPCPLTYPCSDPCQSECSPPPIPSASCDPCGPDICNPDPYCPSPYCPNPCYQNPCYPNPCPVNLYVKCESKSYPTKTPKPVSAPNDQLFYKKFLSSLLDLPGSMATNMLSGECTA